MRNLLLEGLLLVALLAAFAASSNRTFGGSPRFCFPSADATNCTFNSAGSCQTSPRKKGEPRFYSACIPCRFAFC